MAMRDFFRRVLLPVRQRPISSDLNALQTRVESTLRSIMAMATGVAIESAPTTSVGAALAATGFYSTGFRVAEAAGFTIVVSPGVGCSTSGPTSATTIDGDLGADWTQDPFIGAPLVLSNYQPFVVPAAPAVGHSRIDIIEVRADYLATDPQTVGIFNAITEVFDPTVRNKSLDWDLFGRTGNVNAPNPSTAPISYVTGVDFAGGIAGATEPATTSGYIKIGRINLDGAVAAITQALIADTRPIVFPGGMVHVGGDITVPGVVGGIGSEAVNIAELPPGVVAKVGFFNNVAPSAGESYTAHIYLIGGNLTPKTPNIVAGTDIRGVISLTSRSPVPRIGAVVALPMADVMVATDVARLSGSDANFTVMNGAYTYALGQPFVMFQVKILHPTGAALSAAESFQFTATISEG